MNRFLSILLCLALCLPLSACVMLPPVSDLGGTTPPTSEGDGTPETDGAAATISEDEALQLVRSQFASLDAAIDRDVRLQYWVLDARETLGQADYYHVVRLSWCLEGARAMASDERLVHKQSGAISERSEKSKIDLEAHYSAIKTVDGYRYAVFDTDKQIVMQASCEREPRFFMEAHTILCISLAMEDGGRQYQLYDTERDRFSKVFDYAVAASEGLVAYLTGPLDARVVVVESMFGDTSFYKEFHLDLEKKPMPVLSASIFGGDLYLRYHAIGDSKSDVRLPLTAPNETYSFESYKSLLRMVDRILFIIPYFNDFVDYSEAFGITSEQEAAWFDTLFTSLLTLYPLDEEGNRDVDGQMAFGFTVRDINDDGVFELLLLRNDYTLVAIFTTVDDRPILLKSGTNRTTVFIDERGLLYEVGSNGADTNQRTVLRLNGETGKTEILAQFGLDGHEWVDGEAVQLYCQMINGEKHRISEAEYLSLLDEHWGFLEGRTPAVYHRDTLRLHFLSIPDKYAPFELAAFYENYEDIIGDAVPMTEDELAELASRREVAMFRTLITSFANSSPEWYKKTTQFALVDMDGDGILDLLLRNGEFTYLLRYADLDSRELRLNLLHINLPTELLQNGMMFSHTYSLNSNVRKIHIFHGGFTDSYYEGSHYVERTTYFAYENADGTASYEPYETKDAFLAALRAEGLRFAYWYDFTEENVQTYLPCDQPLPFTTLTFDSYDSLLKSIHHLTSSYNIRKIEPYYRDKLDILFDCSTQERLDTYLFLKERVDRMYPTALGGSSPKEDAIGYAFSDLDEDGSDELLLFSGENFWVYVVFTLSNGVPTLYTKELPFEQVRYDQQLAYWETTIGIDVLPLFPESDCFDLPQPPTDGK